MVEWNQKKVLVTGAGGFIGSHLVECLASLGASVIAVVRYNSRNDAGFMEKVDKLNGLIRVVSADVTELETMCRLVMGTDIVFHLAALVGIPYSYSHPHEVFDVNAVGTLNILTAARMAGIQKIVVTSTSEVYGTARYVPIDEAHPKQSQSPYAASKIASDAVALSFHKSYKLPVSIVRPFNTYGPRQSDRAIIPTIICQALIKDEIRIGHTTPTRDFTYVSDMVHGFIKIAESDATVGEEVNLGCGEETSIRHLAEEIVSLVGRDIRIEYMPQRARPNSSEVMRLSCNNNKARCLTGWAPRIELSQGLRLTIEWIKANANYFDPNSYRI
jgi:NAD dependent epimerase/dehydratase